MGGRREKQQHACIRSAPVCYLARWGFLCADLSEFCCISSTVDGMHIHEACLSWVKAPCGCAQGRSEAVRRLHHRGEPVLQRSFVRVIRGDPGDYEISISPPDLIYTPWSCMVSDYSCFTFKTTLKPARDEFKNQPRSSLFINK